MHGFGWIWGYEFDKSSQALEKQWSRSGSPPTTRHICLYMHFFRNNFFWCLKFRIEKTFLSASFRIESSQLSPSDKCFRSFPFMTKEHFALGVSVCTPEGHFSRLAQGKRLCLMRSEFNMASAGSWQRPGYGCYLQIDPPDWWTKSITDDSSHAQHEWAAVAYGEEERRSVVWFFSADEDLNHMKSTCSLLPCGPWFVFSSCFEQDCKVSTRVMLFSVHKP